MSSEIESVEANVSSDEEGSGEDIERTAKLSPKKEEKSPKENNKKSPVKKTKEEDSGGNESNESGPEENNDEPKLGLLDQPVEITGSRERKKVQRLEYSITTPSKEKHEIPEGSGEKLGECPRIEFQIQKTKTDELKVLHRILFNRPGSGNEIKKNLRRFCGFTFTRDSPEYEKKKNNLDKITIPVLKHICEILDLERSGTKEDVIVRLLEFLLCPKPSGKKVPTSKKRVSGGKTEKHKQKSGKEKKISKKKEESSDEGEESEPEDEEEQNDEIDEKEQEDEEEEEEEVEVDNEDEDSEMDEPKRKRPKAKSKDKKKKESKSKKNEEKKSSKSAKKSKKVTEISSEESSDDEPLAKKTKGPPTDEEIKQLVKKILDGANLEEITMKKVIKQVFDDYPEFDLGDKKDFIKSTVRSLIS